MYPRVMEFDTPVGPLRIEWPPRRLIYAESLEPVAYDPLQTDLTPTITLNGKVISREQADHVISSMAGNVVEVTTTHDAPPDNDLSKGLIQWTPPYPKPGRRYHCRAHLEFRSDCPECERENV